MPLQKLAESSTTTSFDSPGALRDLGWSRLILLWVLFFFFSLALGYPTLNRYDARKLGRDQNVYYSMVVGATPATPYDIPFCFRLLVPSVAKPFYWLARGKLATWDPVWFGMLISNSLFCAIFALLLFMAGYRVLRDPSIALLGCTLVFLDYAVPDLWLSGFVDAAEACLLMAVAWCLLRCRWWPLPFIGFLGGFAKQSFLPFAVIFAAVWWLTNEKSRRTYGQLACVAALGATTFASIVFAYWTVTGHFLMPWNMASEWWSGGSYLANLMFAIGDHRFWYPFVWLVPLGAWRLNRFPRPWVLATLVTALFALALAAYTQMGNGDSRPIFNVIAPLFSMSVASLIATRDPWPPSKQAHKLSE